MNGYAAVILFALLAMPAVRHALERVMFAHMLVQIPLLALVGVIGARAIPPALRERFATWNRGGVSGALLALIASSWWMVPRALDWALASPFMEAAKFVTLPLFVGAPLALSWSPLGRMGRGFVIANVLPMWAVVGWAYIVAPVRVCNYYLVDQQVVTGVGLVAASVALGVATGLFAFRSSPIGSGSPSDVRPASLSSLVRSAAQQHDADFAEHLESR
jgi:hypothetical protein